MKQNGIEFGLHKVAEPKKGLKESDDNNSEKDSNTKREYKKRDKSIGLPYLPIGYTALKAQKVEIDVLGNLSIKDNTKI
jgi:hypothetical protein